jgi:lysozyme
VTTESRAALRRQLVEHEGLRLRPYADSTGKLTIGIGRNLIDRGISRLEAFQLLDHDIDDAESDLQVFAWFSALDPVRQRALLDLRFNLGPGKFRAFKKMLAAFEARDYEAAAAQLVDSAWASQVQPARRDRLVRQIRTGAEA